MPSADQILNSLREIANTWKIVSIFWHIFFGALAAVLAIGIRPSKRITNLLLGLPFWSVSVVARLSSNPFNGTVFAIVGIVVLLVAVRLPHDTVQVARLWSLIPGVLFFLFGWIYPHFLNTFSYLPYLYAAPIGIIPCPTLILVIGFALMLDDFGSERLNIILGLVGLLYGVLGVAYLHMSLDWVLILGASIPLAHFLRRKRNQNLRRSTVGARSICT